MEEKTTFDARKMSSEEIHDKIMRGYTAYRKEKVQNAGESFYEFRKLHGYDWGKGNKDLTEMMPEPILLSQIKQKMDLRGLMEYARKKGVKVAQLTEQERLSFMT